MWNGVLERIPLEGDELAPNTKGKPLGDSDFFWGSSTMVNAGFMEKPRRGEWRVTDLVREYIAPGIATDEFGRILNARQRDFDRQRKEDLQLRLATEIVPPDRRAETIRSTSALFVDRGLRQLDSVFAPGRGVWRSVVVAELRVRFIGRPEV
ncbi:MAG: hypothetical protein V4755_17845, partial [Curtobacterium sp.]